MIPICGKCILIHLSHMWTCLSMSVSHIWVSPLSEETSHSINCPYLGFCEPSNVNKNSGKNSSRQFAFGKNHSAILTDSVYCKAVTVEHFVSEVMYSPPVLWFLRQRSLSHLFFFNFLLPLSILALFSLNWQENNLLPFKCFPQPQNTSPPPQLLH